MPETQDDASTKIEIARDRTEAARAARMAATCASFQMDVEEELVDEVARSCHNCRYRRWTTESFTCCAPVRQA